MAIVTSQQPQERGVAGEAVPRGDPHQRHAAAEAGEELKGAAVEACDDRHVHVPGSPAAALGEQHHRQPPALGELEQAVLLQVPPHPLCARQHGVVVGHRHAGVAFHLADARHQPVGGGLRDQLLARSPALLGGEQQRAVLHVGAFVHQLGEVLARGAPALRAALRHRLGARLVESFRVALAHRGEVGAGGPVRLGVGERRAHCRVLGRGWWHRGSLWWGRWDHGALGHGRPCAVLRSERHRAIIAQSRVGGDGRRRLSHAQTNPPPAPARVWHLYSLLSPGRDARDLRALYYRHFGDRRKERQLFSAGAFFLTFGAVRGITHAIRAERGPFRNITPGAGTSTT